MKISLYAFSFEKIEHIYMYILVHVYCTVYCGRCYYGGCFNGRATKDNGEGTTWGIAWIFVLIFFYVVLHSHSILNH